MLILFVMGILVVGVVLMTNIMSIFFPFFQQLGTITNYNRSYYGAVSGVERAMLVIKNHQPGFEGSGGWQKTENFGPISDTTNRNTFGIISRGNNSMNWEIKSRVDSNVVPIAGESNIDSDYFEQNSGFNKLTYSNPRGVSLFGNSLSNLERIYLYYDNTTDPNDFYTKTKDINLAKVNSNEIRINISTPNLSSSNLGALNTTKDIDGDGTVDDTLVSRSIGGKDEFGSPFSIKQIQNFSQDTSNSTQYKINLGDTAIRESDINDMNNGNQLVFGNSKSIYPKIVDSNGVRAWPSPDLPNYHNVNPVNNQFSGSSFSQIFQDPRAKNLTLNFGLINLPIDINSKAYPFLRYKATFSSVLGSSVVIPNAYYYIKGNSNAGTHDVQILVKKPVNDSSVFSDFSIIF